MVKSIYEKNKSPSCILSTCIKFNYLIKELKES
jgi:hypothetical protein